jgi:hypothetical protein
MQHIKIEEFFPPSPEITQQLTERMGGKRAAYLRSLTPDVEGVNNNDKEEADSDALLTSMLTNLDDNNRDREEIEESQRWLREIIYHFLGRLAHRLDTEEFRDYSTSECIVKGLSIRLGLKDAADAELLERLATEFSEWLNQCQGRHFVAGWGTLDGTADPANFRLQRFGERRVEPLAAAVGAGELGNDPSSHTPTLESIDHRETIRASKYHDADLILRLYELRREHVMRQAREWFFTFSPTSLQDFVDVLMGPHSGHYRMVLSYWDMAASLVNHGALDEKLFNETGSEMISVYAKLVSFLPELRAAFGSPEMLHNMETVARRIPNIDETIAQMNQRMKQFASLREQENWQQAQSMTR